jgi:site-specific recombinase XerD
VASCADGVVADFLAGFCGHTYAAYRADLTDFFSYCTSTNLDPLQVTRGQVAGYVHHLSAVGRSPATIARRMVVLRGFYNLAVAEYGLTVSPITRIPYRRVRNQTRIRALTGQQLAAFLRAADQAPPRATGLAWLIATTGIRVSEACAAQTHDLRTGDQPGEWWLDVACKGSLRRTVPLHAATWQRLQPLSTADADHIFTTGDGRELDRHTAARDLARVAVRAEIPGRGGATSAQRFVTDSNLRLVSALLQARVLSV